jgi:hypothetical protein
MSEFANLTPSAIEAIQKLESELKEQGSDTVLVAYSGEVSLTLDEIILIQKLSPEALEMIQKLEDDLKAQNTYVALVAFKEDED